MAAPSRRKSSMRNKKKKKRWRSANNLNLQPEDSSGAVFLEDDEDGKSSGYDERF